MFLSVLFPCVDQWLSLVWDPSLTWLRPVPTPVGNLDPFGFAKLPRERKTKWKQTNKSNKNLQPIPVQEQKHSLVFLVARLLLIDRAGPVWRWGRPGCSSRTPYHLRGMHTGRGHSTRWAIPLHLAWSNQPWGREQSPWAEPEGKQRVSLLSLSWFMSLLKPMIHVIGKFKAHHSRGKKNYKVTILPLARRRNRCQAKRQWTEILDNFHQALLRKMKDSS